MRFERELDRVAFRVDVLWCERRYVPLGDDEEAEQQVGVQAFQGKLALPVGDRALNAVRVARWSEDADALAGGGGANEDGGPLQGLARIAQDDAGDGGSFLGGHTNSTDNSEDAQDLH
jgi:hypothetical protein